MFDRLLMNKVWLTLLLLPIVVTCGAQSSAFQFSYPGPDTLSVGPTCTSNLLGRLGTPTVTPTTPGASISLSEFNPSASGFTLNTQLGVGQHIVHWSVSDNLGNSHTFTFPIVLKDQTAPTINTGSLPGNITYASIALVPPPPTLTATDNCTPSANIVLQFDEQGAPALCQAGVMTRTWTATDMVGNSARFTQTITILADQFPPQITTWPSSTSQPCTQNNNPNYQSWLAAQMSSFAATDASGTPVLANQGPSSYPPGCAQNVTVTFTATDACNNTATATATFATSDAQKPVAVQEARDSIVYCTSATNHTSALAHWILLHGRALATDACTPNNQLLWFMEINGTQLDSAQVQAAFAQSFTQGCQPRMVGNQVYPRVSGLIDVDFYVRDLCNNIEHLGKASFAAIDTTKPQIIAPPPTVVQPCLGANNNNAIRNWVQNHGNAVASDYCSNAYWSNYYTWRHKNGFAGSGNPATGPYPIIPPDSCSWWVDATFFVSDGCGNQDSVKVRYNMIDQIPPVFTNLPVVDTFSCNTGIPSGYTTPATDACLAPVQVGYAVEQIAQPCPGTTVHRITWTATDRCGNTATATSRVVLIDRQGPEFTLVPHPYTVTCDAFVLPPPATTGTISATDLCSGVSSITTDTTNTRSTDSTLCGFSQYTVRRVFIATDGCGNTTTATQLITVIDTVGPVFSGFLDTLVNCSSISDPMSVNFPLPTTRDACNLRPYAIQSVGRTVTAGNCADNYNLTLRWSATDACGNTSTFTQVVRARDTIAPMLIGVPANAVVDCAAIPQAPGLGSGLHGADNCDTDISVILNETEIRVPNNANCDHYNYELRREWVATDNCGNHRVYTQLLTVRDSTPPIIICHPDIVVPNFPGACHAITNIPTPVAIFDECTSTAVAARLIDTLAIRNTSGLPNNSAVVDTLRFSFPAPNYSDSWPASTQAHMKITLQKADAEQPDEHFKVYGEANTFLGITSPTASQCGDGFTNLFIPVGMLNSWLSDGNLDLTFVPNGSGPTAINAICPGGSVIVDVQYTYVKPNIPLTVTYQLNQQAPQSFPVLNNLQLPVGQNRVVYSATDCSGNTGSCALQVTINDVEGPQFQVPDTLRYWLGAADCQAMAAIPAPTSYVDNCTLGQPLQAVSPVQAVTFQSDPNAGAIPADLQMTFTNVPSGVYGSGRLRLSYLGDMAEPGEFFTIYSERGGVIGNTTLSPMDSQCLNFHTTSFQLSQDSLRAWSADGVMSFKAVANHDAGNFTEFIHPCGSLSPQMTDGISKWQMSLEYQAVVFDYKVKNTQQAVVASGTIMNSASITNLTAGTYVLEYALSDPSANTSLRNSIIQVIDSIPPVAKCKNSIIPADIGGSGIVTLTPAQINQNSTDNCGIASFALSQTQFSCSQSGNNFPVTMTVTDYSGNSSTCNALIQIQTSGLAPSYFSGACVNQNLQLFANPTNDPNQTFSYQWSGPNQFSSQQANPTIPLASSANEGTYTVTATNINGCSTTATLFVSLIGQPSVPIIQKDKPAYCVGDQIILTTQAYGTTSTSYAWYAGSPGSSTLLGTSTAPQWIFTGTAPGQTNYYVVATVNNCASAPSAPVVVVVNAYPVAQVAQSQLVVCEGMPVQLRANNIQPGITYSWTGPNFTSNLAQATVTTQASGVHQGTYQLVVSANGCSSIPVNVQVQVQSRPQQPVLTTNSPLCSDQSLSLSTTATGVSLYHWVTPAQDTLVTSSGTLQLSPGQVKAGTWRLFVSQNGCASLPSMGTPVIVEQIPQVSALANSPICVSSVLQLQAQTTMQGLNFQWTGPQGFSTFTQNPITNPIGGSYIVTASTPLANCTARDTVDVVAVVNPVITSITSNAPLCATGNTNAQLFAVIFPQGGNYTYAWQGPNGFSSSSAQPIIPNISSAMAGQYHLVVTDSNGCSSTPGSTTITTTDAPVLPILTPVNQLCSGDNLEIFIQNATAYQGTSVKYVWHTPTNGVVMTTSPSFQKTGVSVNDAGLYWVQVMNGNCVSLPSAQINVVVRPIPVTPVISVNTPLCEGDTLKFSTSVSNGQNWLWTGPGGFSATVSNPVIANVVSSLHSGPYRVSYAQNGCRSALSDAAFVDVLPRPTTPLVLQADPVCIDLPTSTLTLLISPNTATPTASYQWYNGANQAAIDQPVLSPYHTIDSLFLFGAGNQSFYVVATADGCRSYPSVPIWVSFDTIPNQTAFAGNDFSHCNQTPIQLQASAPAIGSGRWTQPAGQSLIINNPIQANTPVVGGQAGQAYQFIWNLSNGGCVNYSRDTVRVLVRAFIPAVSVATIDSCFAYEATLKATPDPDGLGYWSQPTSQSLLNVIIAQASDPNTKVTGLEPGNTYTFYWNLPDIGCGASTDTTLVRSIGSEALAGADRTVCAFDSCALLVASPLAAFETGIWTSPNSLVRIASASNATTSVCGLVPGDNMFIWTTNQGKCGHRSLDTLVLRFEQQPILRSDTIQIPFGEQAVFSVLANDLLPASVAEQALTLPQYGTLTRIDRGVYRYNPDIARTGPQLFTYEVCNLFCVDTCPQAVVVIDVLPPTGCEPPTVITPNDDNVNDTFFIPCLESDNANVSEVLIFNSNGDKVFYASPYHNDWDGRGHDGKALTPGTYFYIIKYNGKQKEVSGFLEIRR